MIKLNKMDPGKLIDIITYFLVIIVGIVIVILSFEKIENYVLFMTTFFYILTTLLFISYFSYRKENDYEKLFLSLACAFMTGGLFFISDMKSLVCLGASLLIFVAFVMIIKSLNIFFHQKNKAMECEVKSIITLFLGLVGVVSGYILTHQALFQVVIYGYFFIVFGLISLFEPIICTLLSHNNKK